MRKTTKTQRATTASNTERGTVHEVKAPDALEISMTLFEANAIVSTVVKAARGAGEHDLALTLGTALSKLNEVERALRGTALARVQGRIAAQQAEARRMKGLVDAQR